MVNFNNKSYGINYEGKSRINKQNLSRDEQDRRGSRNSSERKVALGAALGLSLITFTTAAGLYYFGSGKRNFKLKEGDSVSKTLDEMVDYIETRSQKIAPEYFNSKTEPAESVYESATIKTMPKWDTVTADYITEGSAVDTAKVKSIKDTLPKPEGVKKNQLE